MKIRKMLCSRCIIYASDAYRLTEVTGRKKVTCARCGNRRYGAECVLERREKRDNGARGI